MSRFTAIAQRMRLRLIRLLSRVSAHEEYYLVFLSILIGGATGLGAHLFFLLIEEAHHLAYGGGDGLGWYGARLWMLVLLPVVGALAVGIITHLYAREAKGHGVPEVMDAIHRKGGEIRLRVAGSKALASALTIGSGGSAGTEGPIIQIGAAIGSNFGQVLNVNRRHMAVLVACGVAGGIAAIFNAPIAGVMFALEVFLKDFSFRTFSPVVFASVLSSSVTHALRPADEPIFPTVLLPAGDVFNGAELPFFFVLGLLCALAGVLFTRALYRTEDLADALRIPEPIKPAIGAALLGISGVVVVSLGMQGGQQVPSFFGNGYPLIQTALNPQGVIDIGAGALIALFFLKLAATCFTLGSGGSGGVFAPSLFMGACVGGAFGIGLHSLGWIEESHVANYSLVGMAAVVAATTHAPLTAIVILSEITRQPKVVLPIMFAAIVATTLSQRLLKDSIYTLKLRRRGVRLGRLADLTILKRITADQVGLVRVPIVRPDDPLQRLLDLAGDTDAVDFVVVDEDETYQGLVTSDDIRTALLQPEAVPLLLVGELMRTGVPSVQPHETLDLLLDKFARSHVDSLPLASAEDGHRIAGLVTRQAVMDRYQLELDRQSV
ncbi:MAG: chloride channel protein [Planctomycetes bacterium]|nr:chloride channel protein [Planctomycetota bacterium]